MTFICVRVCWMTQEAALNTPLKQKILKNLSHFCSRPWNLIKGKPFSNNPHFQHFLFFFFWTLSSNQTANAETKSRSWAPTGAVSWATLKRGVVWKQGHVVPCWFPRSAPSDWGRKYSSHLCACRPHEYLKHWRCDPLLRDVPPLGMPPRSVRHHVERKITEGRLDAVVGLTEDETRPRPLSLMMLLLSHRCEKRRKKRLQQGFVYR